MFGGLIPERRSRDWTVVVAQPDRVRFVQGQRAPRGRPRLRAYGEAPIGAQGKTLAAALKRLHVGRGPKCATLLRANDYQIMQVEAPNVPPAEMKAAMKWRLKDIIDYPVEEAGYDVLDLPAGEGAPTRNHTVYAITARKDVLQGYVTRLDQAGLRLAVIDIPETAQRNLSELYEEENRGIGMLYLDDAGGLFTLTFRGELYLVRRIDVTMQQVRDAPAGAREEVFSRILLELQRTLDSFDRQFSFIAVAKVLVGPEPEDTGLTAYLAANLGTRVEPVDLRTVIDVPPNLPFDAEMQWRMFHLIGCSLRSEAQAR